MKKHLPWVVLAALTLGVVAGKWGVSVAVALGSFFVVIGLGVDPEAVRPQTYGQDERQVHCQFASA